MIGSPIVGMAPLRLGPAREDVQERNGRMRQSPFDGSERIGPGLEASGNGVPESCGFGVGEGGMAQAWLIVITKTKFAILEGY